MPNLRIASKSHGKAGLALNDHAIAEAIEFLGLELDVVVKFANGKQTIGCHRTKFYADGGIHHSITISTWANAERANHALWHELTHAQQLERIIADLPVVFKPLEWIRAFVKAYGREQKIRGYKRNRFEVEANHVGDVMGADFPLLVKVAEPIVEAMRNVGVFGTTIRDQEAAARIEAFFAALDAEKKAGRQSLAAALLEESL